MALHEEATPAPVASALAVCSSVQLSPRRYTLLRAHSNPSLTPRLFAQSYGQPVSTPLLRATSYSPVQDQESCAKYLSEMRAIMYGDNETPPDKPLQTALVNEVIKAGLVAGPAPGAGRAAHPPTASRPAAVDQGLTPVQISSLNVSSFCGIRWLASNLSVTRTLIDSQATEANAANVYRVRWCIVSKQSG